MMQDERKSKSQLIDELTEMRQRMAEMQVADIDRELRPEEDLELRNRDLKILYEASRALNATLDLDEVLTIVLEEIQRLVDVIGCSVWLVDPDNGELVCRQATGAKSELVRGWRLAPGQGLAGWVAQSGQKLIVPDTRADTRHYKGVDEEIGLEMRSILSVPLRIKDEVIGALHMLHTEVDRFSPPDQRLLESLAATAAIAIENARLYEALKVSQEQARNIIESSSDMIIAVDVERRIVTFNKAAQETFGYGPEEVLGQPVEILYADQQESLAIHKRTSEEGKWVQEILNKRKNGAVFSSLLASSVLHDERGKVVGYMGVSRDVTERKRAEAALRQSQERMRVLVEHLPEGILLLDSRSRIVLANPAAEEFLKVLNPVIVGDRLTRLGGRAIESLLTADPAGPPIELDLKSPQYRMFELAAKPIGFGPEAGGWIVVIRDVTEEREIQEQVQQQERLAAIGQLAAGVAHDFNNILTSIIGFTEIVYRDPMVPEAAREDLERVIQQGQRAAYLTRQILDFSRKSVPVKQPIDMEPYLEETIALLEPAFQSNIDMRVEIEPDADPYLVNADPIQLQQVVTNLAVNAQDAMPDGGAVRFQLSASSALAPAGKPVSPDKQPASWVVLSVSDTGIGIPLENRAYIFEPFFTTKGVGEGSGLGLAQVYGIVKQHGGEIEVDSQVDQGTTFTLFLPRLPASKDMPRVPTSGTVETSSDGTPLGHGQVILLVDDDPGVVDVASEMLRHLGYQVFTATNGREALAIYDNRSEEIDLVITDLTMPEMGGVELAQALRQRSPAIKIIVMAGYLLAADAEDLMAQNIRDWMLKPLRLERLAQTVSRLLLLD